MKKKTITVKFTGSTIGCTEKQISTVKGLGLRRQSDVRTLPNTPAVRGMIKKVIHLVAVEKEE